MRRRLALAVALAVAAPAQAQQTVAYTGVTLWDGTGAPPVERATLVVRDGRVVAAGQVPVPAGATVENLAGRWIVPGLVDAHAHVTGRWAPADVQDETERLAADLRLYASYGVTSLLSLGGEPDAAFALRDRNASPDLPHARLRVAGPVISASDPAEARAAVRANAARGVDWIKIRVDDNLGSGSKMPPEAYRAAIEEAHAAGLKVAAHIFYLGDAKQLLRDGVDLIAHSVRDADVDAELVGLLEARDVCYVPTLTREVSAFVYARRPSFFDERFFDAETFAPEVERLTRPEYQRSLQESAAAMAYRMALVQAQENVGRLGETDVRIAFGTDAGQPGRFPGFFEHLELSLMVEGGLSPERALLSATRDAAACAGLADVGTLEAGQWADFLVLAGDPLAAIDATRSLERVYVAGNRVR